MPLSDHEAILLLSQRFDAFAAEVRGWRSDTEQRLGQGVRHFQAADRHFDQIDAALSDLRRIVQAETLRTQADLRALEDRFEKLDSALADLVDEIRGYQHYARGVAWAVGGIGLLAGIPAFQALAKLLGV